MRERISYEGKNILLGRYTFDREMVKEGDTYIEIDELERGRVTV